MAAAPWDAALAALPRLARLDADARRRLRELAGAFLREKNLEPVRGLQLTPAMGATIAALACLPILELGLDWYRGWRTLVVYPDEFIRPREEFDDAGVLHQWEEVLGGEAWERGPVVLSWADVQASGRGEGYNVVIHEMAHQLDMLGDGVADGFPPLHRGMRTRDWTAAFSRAFEDLNARVDAGEDTAVDPYAAESPGEFFAVLSEYFFELPDLLWDEYPEVYRQLALFYRQEPSPSPSLRQNPSG